MADIRAPQTIAAANGIATDSAFRSVAPPIYLSSTFAFDGYERSGSYDYTRAGNPTRALLAETLAKLEGGVGAVVTASGMGAVDLVLATLEPGDLVIAPHDCYGGSYRLFAARHAKRQFDLAFVDLADEQALAEAFKRSPALVWIETPSNPLMRIVDIRAIANRAKSAGVKVAVDNTFLSPALQLPIALGADYVVHSTTKYLNGHSDVVGGAVIAATEAILKPLVDWANIAGLAGAPLDSYLTLRGLRTLFPRIERQQQTALAVAMFLHQHPRVTAVHYPGLPSHPGHDIARAQQSGYGAMLSFELAGGVEEVRRFVETVSVFTLAESLGGVESLIAHPATMTHVSMGAEARRTAGITDNLLRLSIGLEAEMDLLNDLDLAFSSLDHS
jgi:cystathionine gamma-synthase